MKTIGKAPKDQIESYRTPPIGKLFKGTKHNEYIERLFKPMTLHQTRRSDIKGKGAK